MQGCILSGVSGENFPGLLHLLEAVPLPWFVFSFYLQSQQWLMESFLSYLALTVTLLLHLPHLKDPVLTLGPAK